MDDNTKPRNTDLCDDAEFKRSIEEYERRIDTLGDIIKSCCESGIYANLSMEEKVKYDLFLSYSLTSLYWVYLRTQGEEPAGHIKSELDRVKKYMDRSKQIHDRKSMPKLDQGAAKRFVKSGLWDPNSNDSRTSKKRKHTTFEDDSEK